MSVLIHKVLALICCSLIAASAFADVRSNGARQLVLVVTPQWNANQGVMSTFEWQQDRWQLREAGTSVTIGRSGSAWGIGLHEAQPGKQKQEGDGRSPAGMFAIGTAFGYGGVASKLAYRAMTQFDYCIDVNASPLYNRIVDARDVGTAAIAGSTEPMRRDVHANGDQRYKLGFVIEHNPQNLSAKGSCIFAHLWEDVGQTTAGCTAMDEAAMSSLVSWLDADKRPVFVLLPRAEYERLRTSWRLPDAATTR